MIIKPRPLGSSRLENNELSEDKRNCIKIGPCGLGEKAIYLNSFYLDRIYYAEYSKIDRIFKRVAMSKGGFTGKGIFGSIPYLVVLFKDGTEKICNFKYEFQVDQILEQVHEAFPNIPIHSRDAERRLAAAAAAEEARYLKELSPEAEKSVAALREAKKTLENNRALSNQLAFDAKQKRTLDSINPTYRYLAVIVFTAAVVCALWGLKTVAEQGLRTGGVYVLLGFAFIFFIISSRVLPSGRSNKKYGDECYRRSLEEMEKVLSENTDYPLPAVYAHPIVIDRMIRVIREGRTKSIGGAMELVKADLKALNPNVTVTQKEYDEVVVVKPLFTVNNYA
ncbi:MAG: ATPase P [Lachnospiraceae bacterium]|nr:ATPase P [Lachnospiraceae bacterium]